MAAILIYLVQKYYPKKIDIFQWSLTYIFNILQSSDASIDSASQVRKSDILLLQTAGNQKHHAGVLFNIRILTASFVKVNKMV